MWTITTCLVAWWRCMLQLSVEIVVVILISMFYIKETL